MIVSIKHKGLRLYYEKGDGSKLQRPHLIRIKLILSALDAISSEDDIRALGKNIHPLKGEYSGFWALSVTGNYRIIFRFEAPDILDVDYIDYH
jgi:proteic killer suppression protein